MKNTKTKKQEQVTISTAKNKKGISNHKKIAKHFEAAAQSHLDAAKHHKNKNHKKAAKSTIEAYGHSNLAQEAQREDVRHHIMKG